MLQLKEERKQFLKQRKEKPILKKGGDRESEVSFLFKSLKLELLRRMSQKICTLLERLPFPYQLYM